MKLLVVTGLYSPQLLGQFVRKSKGDVQNSANVFQWCVVEGLIKNGVECEVVSLPFLPSPPAYRGVVVPSGEICFEGAKIGRSLTYCNLPVAKRWFIRRALERYLWSWLERCKGDEPLVVLTYSTYTPFLKAIECVKRQSGRKITVVSIVTDFTDVAAVDGKHIHTRLVQHLRNIQTRKEMRDTRRLYDSIDGYVLLTKYMTERIPSVGDSYVVVEGVASPQPLTLLAKDDAQRTLLYTGVLADFACIRELLSAFRKTTNPNFRLVMCGIGPLASEVESAAAADNRIVFKGLVTRNEAVQLQRSATALINPRMPHSEITRYSFPSKTMEYLASGTPMMGYRLEGIPEEYYDHFYTIDALDVDTLSARIEQVLSLPQSELDRKAIEAYAFVASNKTSEVQARKIADFMSSLICRVNESA